MSYRLLLLLMNLFFYFGLGLVYRLGRLRDRLCLFGAFSRLAGIVHDHRKLLLLLLEKAIVLFVPISELSEHVSQFIIRRKRLVLLMHLIEHFGLLFVIITSVRCVASGFTDRVSQRTGQLDLFTFLRRLWSCRFNLSWQIIIGGNCLEKLVCIARERVKEVEAQGMLLFQFFLLLAFFGDGYSTSNNVVLPLLLSI